MDWILGSGLKLIVFYVWLGARRVEKLKTDTEETGKFSKSKNRQ